MLSVLFGASIISNAHMSSINLSTTETTRSSETEGPQLTQNVKFRIYELMAENGIKSVAALHRKMIEMRVPVSHSQLLRIVDNRADHWKVQYINAFLDIFNCQVADLFKVETGKEGQRPQ